MDPKELFKQAASQANGCAGQIQSGQLANKTPCSEWDLKALLNHLVYELLWIPELLGGKTVAEVGDKYDGDVLGSDPNAAWQAALDVALAAVEAADLDIPTHLSYADVPASRYITEMAGEVLLHGWDIAQSIKCSLIFDPAVAEAVYKYYLPNIKGFQDGGFVGKAVEVPADASVQTKLLAMMGRRDRG